MGLVVTDLVYCGCGRLTGNASNTIFVSMATRQILVFLEVSCTTSPALCLLKITSSIIHCPSPVRQTASPFYRTSVLTTMCGAKFDPVCFLCSEQGREAGC